MLGPEHPDTLMSVYSLALLLQSQQQDDNASMLYERVCTGYEKTLGSDHHTTLICSESFSKFLEEIRRQNAS
jgi:hypothetical protein